MIGAVDQMQRRASTELLARPASASRAPRACRRVPCRNSIGTCTSARCSARSPDGLPAGCSGKPKNARPTTPGSGAAACACEVMRPPKDLPPAISGRPGRRAPLRRPRRAPPRAQPPADRAACRPSPCRGTDSAASRCRARRAFGRSAMKDASCRRPRHARTRSRRAHRAAASAMPTRSPIFQPRS